MLKAHHEGKKANQHKINMRLCDDEISRLVHNFFAALEIELHLLLDILIYNAQSGFYWIPQNGINRWISFSYKNKHSIDFNFFNTDIPLFS